MIRHISNFISDKTNYNKIYGVTIQISLVMKQIIIKYMMIFNFLNKTNGQT
jgi:hypothetical protein